ncbi:MAG: hypothetical protein AMJ92_05735 [candidate division Zixibacteria bacterium SM23_81]|nr:MAG: hypothetical protein AMJ92_05735 [candidate division Zixibacteria bacterium SM23_81]
MGNLAGPMQMKGVKLSAGWRSGQGVRLDRKVGPDIAEFHRKSDVKFTSWPSIAFVETLPSDRQKKR